MSSKALFHVTVKGVIYKEGKFLLLKKKQESQDHFGFWELPGGGMEYDETPIEAMKREAWEETGLVIRVIGPISTFYVKRPQKQIVGLIFLCETSDEDVRLSDEHQDYVFVDREEAKQYLAAKIYADIFENEIQ